ncbi:MAG: Zn-ribbon domain-containing OB-fold protein [Chloroflexota bacterium]
MSYNKPLPKIDPLIKPFWDNAAEGKLVVQSCKACGDNHFPPSPVCPQCLSTDQDWVQVSGRGTLESWVDFHRAYWDGFKEDLPYRVCLVRLEEGPVVISNLIGDSANARMGAKLEVVFDAVTEQVTLPKFKMA